MLGRQQIAGIPTAISELFKNAHDAYADAVEVDFLRWNGLFVLRDDGIGMTRTDFEERWLTLGTESKLGGTSRLSPPARLPGKRKRPLLGEKGIGRLAIAVIGSQVLVMSRAHDPPSSPLVCAFINWTLFETPGIRLDEIEVPIRDVPPGELPDTSLTAELLESCRSTTEALGETISSARRRQILAELQQFADVDPKSLDAELGQPSLRTGHGTQFLILPVHEPLIASLEEPTGRFSASPLRKALVGFTNTMTSEADPIIETRFRDHKTRDSYDEIIGGEFFTPEEFHEADHHIEGQFDEYGQFVGRVSVYQQQSVRHVVSWPQAGGRKTDCGPFQLRVAIVQGERSATKVPPEEWARLTTRLDEIGGLYVYRDGIRVLPYGGPDFDWVGIELRRTKSASYYYFSYRRIFGHVDITTKQNSRLNEKAGREGFQENRAYRQFRGILENFFVQIAADFFREGGVEFETFQEIRGELEHAEELRRRRQKQRRVRLAQFRSSLAESSDAIAGGDVSDAVEEVIDSLRKDLAAAATRTDPGEVASGFIAAESRARAELLSLREQFRVRSPRGFGLTRALRREWQAYQAAWADVDRGTIEPAFTEIDRVVAAETEAHRVAVDRRRRFEEVLQATIDDARRSTRGSERDAGRALQEAQERVTALRKKSLADLDRTIQEIQAEIARVDVTQLSDDKFVDTRSALEDRIVTVAEAERETLTVLADQLQSVAIGRNGDGAISPLELTGALEEELLALREQADEELELAQLGMALSVITHEFDVSIRAVRSNLRRLRSWADVNEDIRGLYENLRTSFDHLDAYLTLFTPLQRRLYRKQVEIVGAEIETFLRDLFGERMSRHAVKLEVTSAFRRHRFVGYPSTFYPVFVNLVDNSLYWVSEAQEPRFIRLDAADGSMMVSDSGPGVPERDHDEIFERGFTRKPGGRGLGLYISRDVLQREGHTLDLIPGGEGGAIFEIRKTDDEGGRDGDV